LPIEITDTERIFYEVERHQHDKMSFSFILFDIDKFKFITDNFGHELDGMIL